MAATIKDIARRLNLSVSTVSYALNGGPKPVSPDVRAQVLDLAKELDYRPNRQARSLITGRNSVIGVVFPAIARNTLQSPFLQHTLNGIVNAAEEMGQDLLLLTAADRNLPEGFPEDTIDTRIDGVIFIAPPVDSPAVRVLTERGKPYAVLGGDSRSQGLSFNADNRGGVRQAIDHLVGLGHRRIAHISGLKHQTDGQTRLAAFCDAMAAQGLSVPEEYVQEGNFHMDGGANGLRALMALAEPPTAIFCANDGTVFGAIQAAHALGVRVPEDVSLVGFDDHYMSEVFQPPVTTVRQPLDEMGAASLRALVAHAKGEETPAETIFPTQLVVRATTASPREMNS